MVVGRTVRILWAGVGMKNQQPPLEHLKMSNTIRRADLQPGITVRIVKKSDQPTGKLTTGIVARILTNSPSHPHGIKVMLTDGSVGRVQEILPL